MDEEQVNPPQASASTPGQRPWLAVAGLFLLVIGVCLFYFGRERNRARELDVKNAALAASLNQTRAQLEDMGNKLNSLNSAVELERARAAEQAPTTTARVRGRSKAPRRPAEDARWKQIRSELEENRKQLASTQEKLDQTRNELEGRLNSTRDELGSSIARNHDELVALEKRGERNYYEFDLSKRKEFQRFGPLSLSLRGTNTKKESYDMVVLMDDYRLTKKHVGLFEPILMYPSDTKQPLQLVVNRIDKNRVRGYVSEPKYKASELAGVAGEGEETSTSSKSQERLNLAHRPESIP